MERHFPSLDGLRALSILPVIWHHCSLTPLPGLLGKGPAGVQLFFVISGFLVTTLLLRERSDHGDIALGRFFGRRALRIFPLYYVVLAVVAVHTLLSAPSPSRTHFFESFWYYATYTSNWWVDWKVTHPILFGFAWTLAIEEQFYALWPPVLKFLRSAGAHLVVALGLLLLSELVTWPELASYFPARGFWRTFCLGLSSSIALGCLLALVLHQPKGHALLQRLLSTRAAAPLCAVLVYASLALEWHHLAFHGALCLWVASSVVRPDHGLAPLLNHPILVHLGRLSYGLYLTHFVAVGAARRLVSAEEPVLVFLVALPLAYALAEAGYRIIELPFLRLKGRLGPAARASASTDAAVPASLRVS